MTYRFFVAIGIISLVFILGYSYEFFITIAKALIVLLVATTIIEIYILQKKSNVITLNRRVGDKLSLGDPQKVEYDISNSYAKDLSIHLIDEYPEQLQIRDQHLLLTIEGESEITKQVEIKPVIRGNYNFGYLYGYISHRFPRLVEWRSVHNEPKDVKVIPSYIQMRKYELQVFAKTAVHQGIRRVRRLGENDEFESIRNYVQGDNIKSINWKATSRTSDLMVNQYQNTRSQEIYCVIDKGRSMKMPFYGMTLLDHAINSTLVLSNIILKKFDKAGVITFSHQLDPVLKAELKERQIEYIAQHLYGQKTDFLDSNFEYLYFKLRRQLKKRSILFFFTNFETEVDLQRNLKYLRELNSRHLLVVITFVNTEIEDAAQATAKDKKDIYFLTMAKSSMIEKEKIVVTMRLNGIQSILTRPEDLSIAVINKYLELKAKRKQ